MIISCEKAAELLCESLDHPLPLGKRLSLQLHLLLCSMCRVNAEQIKNMHASLAKACADMPVATLSEGAKQKLKNMLK